MIATIFIRRGTVQAPRRSMPPKIAYSVSRSRSAGSSAGTTVGTTAGTGAIGPATSGRSASRASMSAGLSDVCATVTRRSNSSTSSASCAKWSERRAMTRSRVSCARRISARFGWVRLVGRSASLTRAVYRRDASGKGAVGGQAADWRQSASSCQFGRALLPGLSIGLSALLALAAAASRGWRRRRRHSRRLRRARRLLERRRVLCRPAHAHEGRASRGAGGGCRAPERAADARRKQGARRARLMDGPGDGDTRRVVGETCDAVVEVLSLTTALALTAQPARATPPPSTATTAAAAAAVRRPRRRRQIAAAAAGAASKAARAGAPARRAQAARSSRSRPRSKSRPSSR